MSSSIPVYTISLPEYTVEQEPDFPAIGRKLDQVIETHFPGKWMAIRGIGLVDHPSWSLDDLVSTIREIGTDKYDPDRGGVHEEYYQGFTIDLFACAFIVSDGLHSPHYHGERCPSGSVMAEVLGDFYGGALFDRGYSIRLDILMIYDLDQLEPVPMRWTPEGPAPGPAPLPTKSCCFTFKHPDQKKKALLGIIKILR